MCEAYVIPFLFGSFFTVCHPYIDVHFLKCFFCNLYINNCLAMKDILAYKKSTFDIKSKTRENAVCFPKYSIPHRMLAQLQIKMIPGN